MKRKIKFIGSVSAIVVAILAFILVNNSSSKDNKVEESSEQIATKFYQEYYYPLVTTGKESNEVKEDLGTKKEEGIQISINDILKVSELEDTENKEYIEEHKEVFDLDESYVTIYPNEPYEDKNCKVSVTLVEVEK